MRLGSAAAVLLRLYCRRRAASFERALEDPARAQRRSLARILAHCAPTEYARALGVAPALGPDEFRARAPVVDYAALEPWIERQRSNCGAILTPGRVRTYELTSGSSGCAKHIAYNDALLASFRALFAIWAFDLLANVLRPQSGRIFMSVSTPVRRDGFADDREYLGRPLRMLLSRFLVLPPRLGDSESAAAWRDRLACALAECADLEVVSVWNPSYFLILLEHLEQHRQRLAPALSPRRRALFERAAVCWPEVWPSLQLISCWSEGAALATASRLAALFPGVRMQGKGLLATEAPVSVPLIAAGGCVPLVDEVFLELEDGGGNLRLLHEVRSGEEYAVVVSHAGGLLRYRLGDRVKIGGWYRGTPTVSFAGRADEVADLVGEKLSEAFVAQALAELVQPGAFCTLLPVLPHIGRPHYRLLTDDPRAELAAAVDAVLLKAFRYREARLLGQLDCVRATYRQDMRRAVHDALAAGGMRAGDIKDRALIASPKLARALCERLPEDQPAAA